MTEAKTIKLLLTNGSLSGLLMAELLKWDGILFSSPRESYYLLSNEPESKYWGVYLLVSEDKVYVGQANDLLRRISEHDKTKDWWEKVVLLTTKDNSLNRSDIDYLENKMIGISSSMGSLEMSNIQTGNTTKVSRYREAELIDFLEGGLLLLELIGIKVFTKYQKPLPLNNNKISTSKPLTEDMKTNATHKENELYVINKSKAIKHLKTNHDIQMAEGNVTFASLQTKKMTYWANPNVDFLDSRWYIILHNQLLKELTILEIPPKTFTTNGDLTDKKLVIRNDKPYYVDLNIRQKDFIDLRSKCDFSLYIKKVVRY